MPKQELNLFQLTAGSMAEPRARSARFQVNPVWQYDSAIEREPRFRAIPLDEFIDRMAITTLRFRRSKAANHGGLGLIEIWKT
jgi:hypothetical protein